MQVKRALGMPAPTKVSFQRKVSGIIDHKYADFTVIILILLSVLFLLVEHIFEDYAIGEGKQFFYYINSFFTVIFSIELIMRWLALKKKSRFFRSYWIDILAVIAPFFRTLRFLRVLRLLRMFRVGKLLNRRFSSVETLIEHSFAQHFWLVVILITLILAGAISFHLAEGGTGEFRHFGNAVWWTLFTLVGGEPLTGAPAATFSGRLVTLLVMLTGLITFAIFTGVIAAIMTNKLKPQLEMGDMDIDDLNDHVVICGWNRALGLLLEVLQKSAEYQEKGIVLVAEYKDDEPDSLLSVEQIPNPSSLYLVKGDFTCTEVLIRAGIKRASEAIILADKCKQRSDQDRDARSILAALLIEKLNPKIFTSVEILRRENSSHLKYAGVEEILVTDDYAGPLLANAQRTRGLIPMLDQLFNPTNENQFHKIDIPGLWVGKTVGEIYQILKLEYNATLVSLETLEESRYQMKLNPPNEHVIQPTDKMVVIASSSMSFSNGF